MRTHAQAVVIGGGLVGCSILYHLAKLGWRDVVLLERSELTSGSTWHAAANIHGLHDVTNISRLQHYTMGLYKELEAETGQGCGIFQPGSLYLAQTAAREHQLRIQAAKARRYGMNFHEIGRHEAERLHPLVNFDGIRCIMYEPDGGNVDPSGVTHAYAAGARRMGAEIHRFTPVTGTEAQPGGGWIVRTDAGEIRTVWVVNAAGLWAREVGRMAGIELPLIPTEHQYFVTETIPEIAALGRRLPSVADRDGEYYLRQEGLGLLIGAYEKEMKFWAEEGTPPGFGHELFADDLDRIEANMMRAIDRVAAVGEAGIKRVINGPMIWSPDSSALFGPVPELAGYFCCNGIIPGFSQSGGLGKLAAEWMIEGEPSLDLFGWDLARYGHWADRAFTKARVRDQYSHRFKIHFPNEEREAGRPVRTRPAYDMQKRIGGIFGLNYGWEHPLWFAAEGEPDHETYGFTRQNWWAPVGREVRMLRAAAGIIDISNFAKYAVKGPGAEAWLNAVFANRMPIRAGRSCLTPLIGARGGIAGDFTVTRLDDEEFLVVGSGMAERFHHRFFKAVPLPEGTTFESQTEALCGFNVAGPKSRDLLAELTDADLSDTAFPFMRSARIVVAGVRTVAIRVSFTGDLGWELHCAAQDQCTLYTALLEAGRAVGVAPVGSRALMSLRVEKGYGSWGRDYSPEYWPQECGLARLIRPDKDFLNKAAWQQIADLPPREVMTMLEIDAADADASGAEPVFLTDGTPAGQVSSGAYGYSVGKSLAIAYLKAGLVRPGEAVHVAILGRDHTARVLARPPFDPDGHRLRGMVPVQEMAAIDDLIGDIRSRFAHVDTCPFEGPRIYFENAGGALHLKSVIETSAAYAGYPDNQGRDNPASGALMAAISKGRADMRAFLNAPGGEIFTGESGTEVLFRLIRTAALSAGEGGVMLGSTLEHPASRSAMAHWAEATGRPHVLAVHGNATGTVDLAAYNAVITPDVRVATIVQTSPVTGMAVDVASVAAAIRARAPDAFIIVDGIQHASHGHIDCAAYGVDGYAVSPYKVFSRHGYGFGWASDRVTACPKEQIVGGAPANWELGTRDAGAYATFSDVVDYFDWLGTHFTDSPDRRHRIEAAAAAIHNHEAALMQAMLHGTGNRRGLADMPGVTVIGGPGTEGREGVVSLVLDKMPSAQLVTFLRGRGIRVHIRNDDHYCGNILHPLGLDTCVRVSVCHYNTRAEVATFLDTMEDAAGSADGEA